MTSPHSAAKVQTFVFQKDSLLDPYPLQTDAAQTVLNSNQGPRDTCRQLCEKTDRVRYSYTDLTWNNVSCCLTVFAAKLGGGYSFLNPTAQPLLLSTWKG